MDIIFEQYRDRLQRKATKGEISSHTITGFTTAARRLSEWLADQGINGSTVTETALEEYFDTLPLSPSSRGTHLRHIQAAYVYAIKRGSIRFNPVLDLASPKLPPNEPKIIPTKALRVMRATATGDRDWLFFHLLAYTGMRRAEAVGLRWEGVRLFEQTIRVVGKGRKARLIPVHPILGEVLKDAQGADDAFVLRSDGKNGLASQTVQDMTKRLSPEYTPHDFRRTVASSLGRNDVSDRHIDRIMGWSKPDVRERFYMNVAGPELQRAILRLYADDPV